MKILKINSMDLIDSGECMQHVESELKKVDYYRSVYEEWSKSDDIEIIFKSDSLEFGVSGIVETFGYTEKSNEFFETGKKDEYKPESISLKLEISAWLDGEEINNFTLNGLDKNEIETKIEKHIESILL